MNALASPPHSCSLCELDPDEATIVRELLKLLRTMGGQGVIEIRKHHRSIQFFRIRREEQLLSPRPTVVP